jgi:hypothetical protein
VLGQKNYKIDLRVEQLQLLTMGFAQGWLDVVAINSFCIARRLVQGRRKKAEHLFLNVIFNKGQSAVTDGPF